MREPSKWFKTFRYLNHRKIKLRQKIFLYICIKCFCTCEWTRANRERKGNIKGQKLFFESLSSFPSCTFSLMSFCSFSLLFSTINNRSAIHKTVRNSSKKEKPRHLCNFNSWSIRHLRGSLFSMRNIKKIEIKI